jgi:dephospho-CoA kinase
MKRIGLTGGIASGKSTVGALFRKHGVPVIDADQVARDIVKPGQPALQEIFETFGEHLQLPDGTLDRKALGNIIFNDPDKRQLLNHITHPRVAQRTQDLMGQLEREQHPFAIYEVPLLFENQLQHTLDATILVALPREQQIKRLIARDEITTQQANQRIDSQMPLEEKRKYADHVIENNGTLRDLETHVQQLVSLFAS